MFNSRNSVIYSINLSKKNPSPPPPPQGRKLNKKERKKGEGGRKGKKGKKIEKEGKKNYVKRKRNIIISLYLMSLGKKIQKIFLSLYF